MQNPNFLNDTAIALLNYMTTEEPLEMLASCKSYYPNIRVVIVDNGSPGHNGVYTIGIATRK